MRIVVNGEPQDLETGTSVAELVRHVGRDPSGPGTAIARNGEVVPRRLWDTMVLQEGDTVEVLTAVGGG